MAKQFNICGEVGGASGSALTFPVLSTPSANNISIKTTTSAIAVANSALFWLAIDLSHTALGWESFKLTAAASTAEQTITDITDSGVLTHVLCPQMSGAGTMTIRITADGALTTFVSETLTSTSRFVGGDFRGWIGDGTPGNAIGIGSGNDAGYGNATAPYIMTTPPQTLSDSKIGIVYTSSLKVTIQASVNISAVANENNAAVCHSLSTPRGL